MKNDGETETTLQDRTIFTIHLLHAASQHDAVTINGSRRMKIEESSPLYETHSCLHENGARLDRSLMISTIRCYSGWRSGEIMMKRFVLSLQSTRDNVAFGSGFYRLVRKFFTACKSHDFVLLIAGFIFSFTIYIKK